MPPSVARQYLEALVVSVQEENTLLLKTLNVFEEAQLVASEELERAVQAVEEAASTFI